MPKCPNCDQRTTRTEDWACQWCGYPLLSNSFRKTDKTYKQLKEESLYMKQPPVMDEIEASTQPDYVTPPTPPEPKTESEPEPVPEAIAEKTPETRTQPVSQAEPEPAPEAMPEPLPETKTEPVSQAEAEPAPEAVPEPLPEAKTEPIPQAESEPAPEAVPEPLPETKTEPVSQAEMEINVEDLLSAYETDGEAADARFTNNILKITGVVDRIEVKDTLDIKYITLASAEKKRLQTVRCVFSKPNGSELSQLTPGQTVTVRGKYDGSIIDIRMSDCVLVH